MSDLYAVIMAGGRGQRFWPLSTAAKPKQFLDLERTGRTLIQSTFDRLLCVTGNSSRILVATAERYVTLVREQLPNLPEANLIVEPEGRDSGPAIALASLLIQERFGDCLLGFFAADHSIGDTSAFTTAISGASRLATMTEGLVTVGITPTRVATGYGYIEQGDPVHNGFRVRRFVEKPGASTAERYVESGGYLWNAGIFVWSTQAILRELQLHCPEIVVPLRNALGSEALSPSFRSLPSISIDYALLEKSSNVFVVPGMFEWDDIGDWVSLERHLSNAEDANTVVGRHIGHDASGNIIYTEGPDDIVITLGIRDLLLVKHGNTVLLLPKSRVQDIKTILVDERLAGLEGD